MSPTAPFSLLSLPYDYDGFSPHGYITALAIEVAPNSFVGAGRVTDDDYARAAELAHKRLKRCRPGSLRWRWYQAVIGEHRRRRRAKLQLIDGGPCAS